MRRSGFTLIMAIFLLLAIAAMLGAMISYTSETSQKTTDIYMKEQAILLAKSATEYALLAISAHDRTATGNCISDIDTTYTAGGIRMFDINTSIRYFGLGSIAGCPNLAATIATPESNGTVIIDVTVTENSATRNLNPIRYHRRTIQKP